MSDPIEGQNRIQFFNFHSSYSRFRLVSLVQKEFPPKAGNQKRKRRSKKWPPLNLPQSPTPPLCNGLIRFVLSEGDCTLFEVAGISFHQPSDKVVERGRPITDNNSWICFLFTPCCHVPSTHLQPPLPLCLTELCAADCGGHGICVAGSCRCDEGWVGAGCDQRACHPRCSEHGTCKDGKCECSPGWNGEHCTIGKCVWGCVKCRARVGSRFGGRGGPGGVREACVIEFVQRGIAWTGLLKDMKLAFMHFNVSVILFLLISSSIFSSWRSRFFSFIHFNRKHLHCFERGSHRKDFRTFWWKGFFGSWAVKMLKYRILY